MSFPDDLSHLIRSDEPLGPLVWLGIGGPARFFAEPVNDEQLHALYQSAIAGGVNVRVLGDGSNVLVREAGFDGLVISMAAAACSELRIDGNRLDAGAGAKLSHAVIKAVGGGLGGLEHLVGIPGSVGGAVFGNVSSGGRDIGSAVRSVDVIDESGQPRTITQDEAGFGHRKSALSGYVIRRVVFELESCDAAELTKRMQKLWISRNSVRPSESKRIAMPFVDPDGISARELIASIGLAGLREGGAVMDSTLPNYLVAETGATSEDCLRLIDRIREQVLLQSGVDLQLNLQIW